jgi:dephospho-CoA kinase
MITIGLTGGIASGKSMVAEMFKRLGAYIIDTDMIAREVVEPDCEGWRAVINEFGEQILTPDGTIDRLKLGDIIFSDDTSRHALNNILHPHILRILNERITQIGEKDPEAVVVADVPLLLECRLQNNFDVAVVVWTRPEIQMQRLMVRNGLSRDDALKRINAQMPLDQKRSFATYIIENDKKIANTEKQVQELFIKLKQMASEQHTTQHK